MNKDEEGKVMKKLSGWFALVTVVLCACLFMFAACGDMQGNGGQTPSEHEHTFSEEWSYDAENHWHAATCEHKDLTSEKGAHEFGSENECVVCGYELDAEDVRYFTYTLNTDKSSYALAKAPQNLTEIQVSESYRGLPVTRIGIGAFRGNEDLRSVVLTENIEEIGAYAFYGCTSLRSIDIPFSLKEVGAEAFYGCDWLTQLRIPERLTDIGSSAFEGCSALTDVYISDLGAWCGITFGSETSNPFYYAKNVYHGRVGGVRADRSLCRKRIYFPYGREQNNADCRRMGVVRRRQRAKILFGLLCRNGHRAHIAGGYRRLRI